MEQRIDRILLSLLNPPKQRGGGGGTGYVSLQEEDITWVANTARAIFARQPPLLELEAPIKVAGDLHGQYSDLLRLFHVGGFPPQTNYLFLGDYVDRGRQSIETITLLFLFKIRYPENVFLLRGNHECVSISKIYGFYDECKSRYSVKLWKTFTDTFQWMPIVALIEDRILCMHGGLSPHLKSLDDLRRIRRPIHEIPEEGLVCDLLWADPRPNKKGWGESDRGISFAFGEDVVTQFLEKHDLNLICRAHEVVQDGYEFFARRQLVTIFSAPNYCGEYDNCGAILSISTDLLCSFQILDCRIKR